ncbi:MAG TPA: hypothetical protein VFB66_22155, partial [Tepidisphaeraceae bacterium]|nr:hypothetical protein [Tepidisphaeraceae bacterium]
METNSRVSRRQVVTAGAAACGVALLGKSGLAQLPSGTRRVERPGLPLRFAHLTDTHVQPERRAGEGFAAALQSLSRLDPPPSFIITGGDHVMDVFETDGKRADVQWELYNQVLRANT